MPQRLYDEPTRIHAFARGVLDRVQHLPGVKSASLINTMPFGEFIRGDFDIEGQPKPKLYIGKPKIEAGYFKTMGIPLLAGREFTRKTRPRRRRWRSSASASCAITFRGPRRRRSASACA